MELWKYYRKLYRRKWLIIFGVVLCVGIAFVLALLQKPQYIAVARVMERTPTNAGQNVLQEALYMGIDPEVRLANLSKIASSRNVGERVRTRLASEGITLDLEKLLTSIEVFPERDTQLLRISVTYEDPEVAAKAANLVAVEFGEYYRELIYGPTTQRLYLEDQVEQARQQLEKARQSMESYKSANNVSNLSYATQSTMQRLSDLETQSRMADVTATEANNRLNSVSKELEKLPKTRREQTMTGENQLWLTLANQLKDKEQQLASMLATRGEEHPEVKQLQQSISELKTTFVEEPRQRIVQTLEAANPIYSATMDKYVQARVDSVAAQAKAGALSNVVPQIRSELSRYPEQERQTMALETDVKVAESTYSLLRQKLDEAKIRESEPYATGTIKMVDDAYAERKLSNKKLTIVLALPLSILLSCAVIFLLDYLDNTIRTPEEAEELLGLPVAAMVALGKGHSLVRGLPDPGLRESYQMLSASLWHRKVQEAGNGGIVIASAEPNSGRTVTAGNLAAALAGDGARVILVDADLRQPAQHLVFGIDNSKGFSNILAGSAAIEDVALPTKVEGLLLIPSGPLPDNPIRLMHGEALQKFFEEAISVADFIVFDSPAGSAFADATVLASIIKRVMLVQSAGRVPRGAESEFTGRLEAVGAEVLGVVLNKVRPGDSHSLYHFRTSYSGLPPADSGPSGPVSPTSPAIPG